MLKGDGSGGSEDSGGSEGDFAAGEWERKRICPPNFKGVGVMAGDSGCDGLLDTEGARAVPRTEGNGAGRWCDGGRGAGVGANDWAEWRSREIEEIPFRIGGAAVYQGKKRYGLIVAGKEEDFLDVVLRSGASARFGGRGGEVIEYPLMWLET